MKKILNKNRGGCEQIPISAGKGIDVKPKQIDTATTLTTALSHGSQNQASTFIMVKVKNATNKGFSEVRVGGGTEFEFP